MKAPVNPRSTSAICNALTIDVEDYYQVAAFFDNVTFDEWASFESRVVQNTHRFMALLERRGLHATFFMLGWVAERYPDLVREIAAAGHEIACHGYSHQFIYKQSPEVFKQETLRSKGFLEDTIGAPVPGYRAASYSITNASLWALDIIAEAGFEYDSSIYPIRHDNYGLAGGPYPALSVASVFRTRAARISHHHCPPRAAQPARRRWRLLPPIPLLAYSVAASA